MMEDLIVASWIMLIEQSKERHYSHPLAGSLAIFDKDEYVPA